MKEYILKIISYKWNLIEKSRFVVAERLTKNSYLKKEIKSSEIDCNNIETIILPPKNFNKKVELLESKYDNSAVSLLDVKHSVLLLKNKVEGDGALGQLTSKASSLVCTDLDSGLSVKSRESNLPLNNKTNVSGLSKLSSKEVERLLNKKV